MKKMNLNIKISFELYQEVCQICQNLNIAIDEFVERALKNEIENAKQAGLFK